MNMYVGPSEQRSPHQRANLGLPSRKTGKVKGKGCNKACKKGVTGLKTIAAGYAFLLGYTGITQWLGINFFQLQTDSRAMWLAGAVLVLGFIAAWGCRSAGDRR